MRLACREGKRCRKVPYRPNIGEVQGSGGESGGKSGGNAGARLQGLLGCRLYGIGCRL